eukprot:5081734-Pleurochrysis_carterae.AAC.1
MTYRLATATTKQQATTMTPTTPFAASMRMSPMQTKNTLARNASLGIAALLATAANLDHGTRRTSEN